jgi:membrane-associated phospholipid phosphatase
LLPLNQAADSGVLFFPLLAVIVLTGIVMTARLQLNAHSLREVLSGALVGFAVSFFSLGFLF